ncbi:hypothetical protein Poli38472_001484 [Pythium oligandrum]|uniref:Lipoxygenase domain-containing protein n=1 Tax=Pythium oligandrum TaxID=41045 RepID=A0A8K1FT84_PYTOL|nr:hypothetical protein Poli38472_001484 [Pythium oligandrum]|eukprot:TMW69328.1 hypothetical protein Poli38472_001484 [Pythium oligandrum]
MQLQKLVTHLIYLSGVKHHAMNSAVTWTGVSTPYNYGGLRKVMPTRKGEKVNLMEYGVPLSLLPIAMSAAANYVRPVSKLQSWMSSYDVAPFNQEVALKDVVAEFLASLATIDKLIEKQESGEKWPYDQLRPTSLPYFTWI